MPLHKTRESEAMLFLSPTQGVCRSAFLMIFFRPTEERVIYIEDIVFVD